MKPIKLGNIVIYHGLTWTVTGISAKHYTLTPIYTDTGTIKVPLDAPVERVASSPVSWAVGVLSGEK
jgi:hypothetical protein